MLLQTDSVLAMLEGSYDGYFQLVKHLRPQDRVLCVWGDGSVSFEHVRLSKRIPKIAYNQGGRFATKDAEPSQRYVDIANKCVGALGPGSSFQFHRIDSSMPNENMRVNGLRYHVLTLILGYLYDRNLGAKAYDEVETQSGYKISFERDESPNVKGFYSPIQRITIHGTLHPSYTFGRVLGGNNLNDISVDMGGMNFEEMGRDFSALLAYGDGREAISRMYREMHSFLGYLPHPTSKQEYSRRLLSFMVCKLPLGIGYLQGGGKIINLEGHVGGGVTLYEGSKIHYEVYTSNGDKVYGVVGAHRREDGIIVPGIIPVDFKNN